MQTNAQRVSRSVCSNIFRYAIATSLPPSRDLTSHRAAKLKRFQKGNTGALFEFCEPLTVFTSPDVTLVTILHFEFLPVRPRVGYFNRLEIMDKFHFLIEDLFAGIVATEELRF